MHGVLLDLNRGGGGGVSRRGEVGQANIELERYLNHGHLFLRSSVWAPFTGLGKKQQLLSCETKDILDSGDGLSL